MAKKRRTEPLKQDTRKFGHGNSNKGIVERFLRHATANPERIDLMPHQTKMYYITQMQKVVESFKKNRLDTYNTGSKVHEKQLLFHKCLKRKRGLLGGNRCIAGDSMIYDPVLEEYRRVDQIKEPFHVFAWDEDKEKVVVADATVPFHHDDIDSLYKVVLDDGHTFTCSMNHRLLAADGKYYELQQMHIGELLFGYIKIVDIIYVKEGYKWDFTVEKYHNYFLSGVIHHNTGKTVAGAVEAVWYSRGNHPYKIIERGMDGWVVSLTNEVQRDVAQKEVMKWLNPDWIVEIVTRSGPKDDIDNAVLDYITIKNIFGTTSKIGFKTCEQGRGKFQGTSKDWIWFDEEPPKDIYDECLMRIMDVQGDIWFTMTPLMGITFIHDLIYLNERNDPEVWCQTMSWDDNPFLSPDEIKAMVETLTEEEREARQHGRFVALTGLIYKKYNEDIHVLDAEYDYRHKTLYLIDKDGKRYSKIYHQWYDKFSIDPGMANPTSIHFYARDGEGNIYQLAELYEAGKLPGHHSKNIKTIAELLRWPQHNGGYMGIIDAAANQSNAATEKTVKQLYAENLIFCQNSKKDVFGGIMECMKYMEPRPHYDKKSWPKGKPKFFTLNVVNWPYNNVNFRREIKKYRWLPTDDKVNAKEAPTKKDDHCMDDWKYYVQSLPQLPDVDTALKATPAKKVRKVRMSENERKDMGASNINGYQPIRAGRKVTK